MFLGLNLAIRALAISGPAKGPADLMLQCGIGLDRGAGLAYFVRRSNAVPDRAVCFLGRFLPKLGGAPKAPPFLCVRQEGRIARGKHAALLPVMPAGRDARPPIVYRGRYSRGEWLDRAQPVAARSVTDR